MSKQIGETIMDMIWSTIFEKNFVNNFKPKILLTMTYVKNNRSTKSLLNNITSLKAQNEEIPSLLYLCILGFTIYIFPHEEKRSLKSEK